MRLIGAIVYAAVLLGCGGGGGAPDAGSDAAPDDPSAPLFDPARLLDIDIELAPADWDALRVQHHDFFGRFIDACPGPLTADPYTVFPATITIDGERIENVGVRMKGFLGSVNRTRPSLKVSFDEYLPGREVHGLERMTLNNNQQDHSQLDTCLAYQVFRAAGVPAPRCNWAHVTVNGQDLGTYSHVESVRRRFLAHHFADTSGNLYEGQVSDLRPGWIENYEDKPGNDLDRSDLGALAAAFTTDDAGLLAAVDPVLDVDAFLSFWAAEQLVGHWDGYAGNRNNYYLYRDPATGRFHFLPWGPDAAFGIPSPFLPPGAPPSVWAGGTVTSRLYGLPDTHDRFQDRLRQVLDSAWDETALRAEIDRVEAMLAPYTHVTEPGFSAGVDRVRSFVDQQRGVLEADLATDPAWAWPLPDSYCLQVIGTATGTFTAALASFPPSNPIGGSGTLNLTVNGVTFDFAAVFGWAGPDNDPSHPRIGAAPAGLVQGGNGRAMIPVMFVEPELWTPGTLQVNAYDVFGILLDSTSMTDYTIAGWLRGTLTLDAAPTAMGETASGSFDLQVIGP